MASGRYDVGLVSSPVQDEAIASQHLCDVQAYCVLPAKHRLANKRMVQLSQLDGEQFISPAHDSLFRYTLDALLEDAGVKFRRDIQARTADAIYDMVAAGLGVTIVGPGMPQALKSRHIVYKPLSPAINVPIYMVTANAQPVSRIANRIVDIALKNAKTIARPIAADADKRKRSRN